MKISSLGIVLCHAGGWTDRQTDIQRDRKTGIAKLIVAFHSFAKAPKNFTLSLGGTFVHFFMDFA